MFLQKLKKILFICLSIFLLILSNLSITFADELEDDSLSTDPSFFQNLTSASASSVGIEPTIYSKNIVAIDRATNRILFEKNSKEKVPMASTTKILTCIVALENSNLNDIVTISNKAASIHGSTLGIKTGMKISMNSLLYGLMLRSGNDCAIAIAEHISGDVDNFCKKMNEKAHSLGLVNSNFTSPHGLDNDNHYTTAYELALLTNYALKNETFRKIVSTHNTTITLETSTISIHNTNELLGNVDGVYGVKTGFTFNAGRCLVSSCKREDLDIIVVVLGADTKALRTRDSISIINYIFNNYTLIDTENMLFSTFDTYKNSYSSIVSIEKSNNFPILELEKKDNYIFPILNKKINDIDIKIHCMQKLSYKTPINSQIGIISVYNSDKLLYTANIYLKNSLDRKDTSFYFKYILKNYFNLMYI